MNKPPDFEILVFNAALEMTATERAGYLERTCGEDPELYHRVRELLQVHEDAGCFLDTPVTGARLAIQKDRTTWAGQGGSNVLTPGNRIGAYRILGQIGEGGCGAVYLAEQDQPIKRRVALKVIKPGMDTKNVMARFDAEKQALALMDHPNIAKVLDAGATESGRPFFVMELVLGMRITEYCDRHRLATPARIALSIQVCHAVLHAHQKGIIHRDLKPSNILVTGGEPGSRGMPKVIDFGIAKAMQGRLTEHTLFTAFEQFLGTPAYMSPEQSVITCADIDTRSDIYSLGVLLYELLTGRTPFHHKDLLAGGMDEMRRIIGEEEPLRPSTQLSAMKAGELEIVARARQAEPPKLIHLVRGDLDWIVMKCLEKDRARRYDTVNSLAADLQRFLANEPIVARPPSRRYRLQKWVRRHRLGFATSAATIGAICLGLGLSTWQFIEKSHAEGEQRRLRIVAQSAQAGETQLRRRAEAQELAARRQAYASDMNLLQQALAAEDLVRAKELLDRQRPQPGQTDLRGWEWRYFWQFCQSDVASTLCRFSNSITCVSFSPDGTRLAAGTFAGEVSVWDVASHQLIFQRAASRGRPGRLAFAPTGNLLAFYEGSDKEDGVVLWDCRENVEMRRLPLHAVLRDLAFSRDGRLFTADLGSTNNITVWAVTNGLPLAHYTASLADYDMGTVFNIANNGSRFAQVFEGASHSVQIIELPGGASCRFRVSSELTTALAFSPDGRLLVTGGGYAEGAIRVWELPSRQLLATLDGHRSWVSCLKFLPDGQTVVSASADGTIRLWDWATHQPLRTLRGSSGELWTIDVSPDGGWVASGCKDGSVSLWRLTPSTNRPPPFRTLAAARSGWWEFSPDSRMVGAIAQGRLKLYDAHTLREVGEPDLALNRIWSFGFSPDMRLLVAGDMCGRLSVWDLAANRMITNFPAHSGKIALSSASFLCGGQRLLTQGADGILKEWNVTTWNEIHRWQGAPEYGGNLAICPSANLVATSSQDGRIELISLVDPERRHCFTGQKRMIAIALSRDGSTLAGASENGTVELWDTPTATRAALMHGVMLGYHSVAISPDGERVAAGSNGREAMKLWDLRAQAEVATLGGEGSFFSQAAFAPDGKTIGARNWNGVIHFWSAPSWEEIEASEEPAVGPRN